ncbi:MAG TPA: energy transducer TonB, partial [Gammaproteobacteria bacterium]|nr:energy transducer TonB [Gammaproteobacteria bacterium]
VRAAVQEHWLVPPSLTERKGLRAKVRVSLTPAGELAAPPKIVESNGPGYFDSSVVRAVRKAAPFPMPDGPTRYFQEFELIFSPDMAQ